MHEGMDIAARSRKPLKIVDIVAAGEIIILMQDMCDSKPDKSSVEYFTFGFAIGHDLLVR